MQSKEQLYQEEKNNHEEKVINLNKKISEYKEMEKDYCELQGIC